MESLTSQQMIERYFLATTKAVGMLIAKNLYGHVLILIYSTIDTCGLLDAPASQEEATGESFKNWVKKYMLSPVTEFNEVDLWGARCAVLHSFTTESNRSKYGKARELQYYSGDKNAPHIQQFIAFAKNHEGGKHLAVHYGELCEAFFSALKRFVYALDANCASSAEHNDRLRNIMQVYYVDSAS